MPRPCTHRIRRRVISGDRQAFTCNRPKCIGRAVKWTSRSTGHALIEDTKEEK
jgi:hypothetical protein